MIYRNSKNNPLSKEEVVQLNEVIARIGFKIPELWDPKFLDNLPRRKTDQSPEEDTTIQSDNLSVFKKKLLDLGELNPQSRGFAFEGFLNELFDEVGLNPKKSFRLVGEQIDGSFQLEADTYLVEAKWQDKQVGASALHSFSGKVRGKAEWSRGLFISHSGFSEDGLSSFRSGNSINIIGFSGQDLYFVLDGKVSLNRAIQIKARKAAETGEMYIPLYELVLTY